MASRAICQGCRVSSCLSVHAVALFMCGCRCASTGPHKLSRSCWTVIATGLKRVQVAVATSGNNEVGCGHTMLLFCPEGPMMGFQPERGLSGITRLTADPSSTAQAGQCRDECSDRRAGPLSQLKVACQQIGILSHQAVCIKHQRFLHCCRKVELSMAMTKQLRDVKLSPYVPAIPEHNKTFLILVRTPPKVCSTDRKQRAMLHFLRS